MKQEYKIAHQKEKDYININKLRELEIIPIFQGFFNIVLQ
jgi:hypothetical protein